MSMTGELYRVSAGRLEELLAAPSRIKEELSPADNALDEGKECSVEKTWNAIEFMLDRLAELGRIPWIGPLTEGTETGVSLHYGPVWYRTPQEVRDIANV